MWMVSQTNKKTILRLWVPGPYGQVECGEVALVFPGSVCYGKTDLNSNALIVILWLCLACVPALEAQTNLISNGGFESSAPATNASSFDADQGYYTQLVYTATTYTIGGWTFGKTGPNYTGGGQRGPRFHWFSTGDPPDWAPTPRTGSFAVQLNSDSTTTRVYMEQSVNLTAGQLYVLSFYFIDENNSNAPVGVQVSSPSGSGLTTTTFSYTSPGPGTGDDTWQYAEIYFTASSTGSHTFRLTDMATTNTNQNVILDDIALFAIPEPSTYAAGVLLLVSIGCFHCSRHKRV